MQRLGSHRTRLWRASDRHPLVQALAATFAAEQQRFDRILSAVRAAADESRIIGVWVFGSVARWEDTTGGPVGGQVHDIIGGRALLARVAAMRQFIGDKAYDADDMRDFLAAQGTEAVISPMPRRLMPPSFNPIAYRMRSLIERAWTLLASAAMAPSPTARSSRRYRRSWRAPRDGIGRLLIGGVCDRRALSSGTVFRNGHRLLLLPGAHPGPAKPAPATLSP